MVRIILSDLLERGDHSREVELRTQLMIAIETLLGLRVGDVCGGGDGHGILAKSLAILQDIATGEETVEGFLEHSKTHHRRYVSGLMESKGAAKIELGRFLREYWASVGFDMTPPGRVDAGYHVTGPDYSVLRLSLVALGQSTAEDAAQLDLIVGLLTRSRSPEARKWADYTHLRGSSRLTADSADKRYINVVGGRRFGTDIATVAEELSLAGFGDRIEIVPGPLLRATHGKLGYAHMPLDPGSTYHVLTPLLERAYELAVSESPDPEIDLQGFDVPLWGNHSFRRFADTVARQTMAQTQATEQDIDLYFGWMERFYQSKMQVHYESRFTRTRRTAVTSLA